MIQKLNLRPNSSLTLCAVSFASILLAACNKRQFNETSETKTDLFQETSRFRTGLYAVVPFFHGVSGVPKKSDASDSSKETKEPLSCLYGADFPTKDLQKESLLNDENLLYFKSEVMPVILPKKQKYQRPISTEKLQTYFYELPNQRSEKANFESLSIISGPFGLAAAGLFAISPAGPGIVAGFAISSFVGGVGTLSVTQLFRKDMKQNTVCTVARTLERTTAAAVTTIPTRVKLDKSNVWQGVSGKSIIGEVFHDAVGYFHNDKKLIETGFVDDPSRFCPKNLKLALLQTEVPCDGTAPEDLDLDLRFRKFFEETEESKKNLNKGGDSF